MIQLDFDFDQPDIDEAVTFINKPFPPELCGSLDYWIPNAHVVFTINGDTFELLPKTPVLEFAVQLNEIVHTIKVGEIRKLLLLESGITLRFYLLDSSILAVDARGLSSPCWLAEMQAASEKFCSKVLQEIQTKIPGYFEFMDRLPEGTTTRQESPSEQRLGLLRLFGTQ